MFNLIVGSASVGPYYTVDASRFLEGTKTVDERSSSELELLPTLVMPERGWDDEQLARVGRVSDITRSGRDVRFRFTPIDIPPLAVEEVWDNRRPLGIDDWDFTRSRWVLRGGDLYPVLAEQGLLSRQLQPVGFNMPNVRPEQDRVAVMMPFDGFDPVWDALERVGVNERLHVQRADSIWENHKVMDDVVLLLARASVVICDLTGKNANVFYETGLAHMMGRPTILITQSREDVPFDLQAQRYLHYEPTELGLRRLQVDIRDRLRILRGSTR